MRSFVLELLINVLANLLAEFLTRMDWMIFLLWQMQMPMLNT